MTNTQEMGHPQQELLIEFGGGAVVLAHEAQTIRDAVDLLNILSLDPEDQLMLPIAAEVATDTETPVASAFEILPTIQRAVDPFDPKQSDPTRAVTERWTKDWKTVSEKLKARIEAKPEIQEQLENWFLTRGHTLVETRYASSKNPLYTIVGAANDQCQFRPGLALASMASEEFRASHGLVANGTSLNGEDAREAGWLKDDAFLNELRDHVAARVAAGEINPRIIVGGSAATKRILNPKEVVVVEKYIATGTEPLYPNPESDEPSWREADAMLAGALKVFGRADDSPLEIMPYPSADNDEPARMISFMSPVGPVTFIATTGSEATLEGQLQKVHDHKPEVFDGIDGMYAATTAIYTWGQRPALLAAATKFGLEDIAIDVLGLSAHAAGISRRMEALVGELVNYLKAIYNVANRTLQLAEQNTHYDFDKMREIGDTAVRGAER